MGPSFTLSKTMCVVTAVYTDLISSFMRNETLASAYHLINYGASLLLSIGVAYYYFRLIISVCLSAPSHDFERNRLAYGLYLHLYGLYCSLFTISFIIVIIKEPWTVIHVHCHTHTHTHTQAEQYNLSSKYMYSWDVKVSADDAVD